jgi:hypothetical protein
MSNAFYLLAIQASIPIELDPHLKGRCLMVLRPNSSIAMVIAIGSIALAAAISPAQQGKVTIDDILRVWNERQQKVQRALRVDL